MTPNSPHAWRAQAPSADFADRTARAILRDRATRRATHRPRAVVFAAAACLLVAGAAWAWRTQPGPARREPSQSSLLMPSPERERGRQ